MDKFQIISGHRHRLYDVPEHEVLISFNNDSDAQAFIEWFYQSREAFDKFAESYEE